MYIHNYDFNKEDYITELFNKFSDINHVDEYREIYGDRLVDCYLEKCNGKINLFQMGLQLERGRRLAELWTAYLVEDKFFGISIPTPLERLLSSDSIASSISAP